MPLTVATACPSCGGQLEFEHGANAAACASCGSKHLVTGRGRTLSYFIPEKMSARKAVAAALVALKQEGEPGCTAREATLFFVPFYHFTGQEYSYNVREVAIDGGGVIGPRSFLMVEVRSFDLSEFAPDIESGPRIAEKRFEVSTKHISRSVPAVDAAGLNVFSLGIRPDVLKLSLFEKAAVSKRGRIAPVRVKPADADQIGFGHPGGEETVVRRVSGKVRSIIYFPFWLVEYDTPGGEARVAVLDAVSEEVSNLRAPLTVLDGLIDKDGQEFEVAGLRPLKCPNCAADLPVRPRDVVSMLIPAHGLAGFEAFSTSAGMYTFEPSLV